MSTTYTFGRALGVICTAKIIFLSPVISAVIIIYICSRANTYIIYASRDKVSVCAVLFGVGIGYVISVLISACSLRLCSFFNRCAVGFKNVGYRVTVDLRGDVGGVLCVSCLPYRHLLVVAVLPCVGIRYIISVLISACSLRLCSFFNRCAVGFKNVGYRVTVDLRGDVGGVLCVSCLPYRHLLVVAIYLGIIRKVYEVA